jgi:phosphoglycerate kinase
MAYTFLKAQGVDIGKSLVETEKIALAQELLVQAASLGVTTLFPVDHVTGDSQREHPMVCIGNIPADRIGLDIGPRTIAEFSKALKQAKMVLWNGPVGLFEMEPYSGGSRALAQTLAASHPGLISIVAGGDTVAAVMAAGVGEQITHLSTGGGATLEFLEGKHLPGIKALETIS